MNSKDIATLNLSPYALVDIVNYYGGIERIAPQFIVIPYDIPERCVATYFPEANVLVPIHSIADKSHTPTSKSVIVEIKKPISVKNE